MAAKVEIQIRFISKHHVNDYISTISKNYLSTFTGQQWLSTLLQAQELVSHFKVLEHDLIARTHPHLDLNDAPCVVVRVSAGGIKNYTFEGNIIGDIVYSSGEALIYMTQGSRNITIKSSESGMIKFDFPEMLQK